MEIQQKRFFEKHEIRIMETKILHKRTKFRSQTEITIPYENLSRNIETYTRSKDLFFIPCIVCCVCTFFAFIYRGSAFEINTWIFWFLSALIFGILFHLTKEDQWRIQYQNSFYLYLYQKHPNKETVDAFLTRLFETRDQYLRDLYFNAPNKNISYELQKSDLQWLRRMEVITSAEFNMSIEKLDELFKQEVHKIGFN